MATHESDAADWDEDALLPRNRVRSPADSSPRVSGRPYPDVHGRIEEAPRWLSEDFLQRIGGCFPLLFPSWILLVGALLTWSLEPTVGAGGFHLWILLLVLGIVAGIGGIISYFAEEDEPTSDRAGILTPSKEPLPVPPPIKTRTPPSAAVKTPRIAIPDDRGERIGWLPSSGPAPSPRGQNMSPTVSSASPAAEEPESDSAVHELDRLKQDLDSLRRSTPAKS
jgi:hypothetical protein